MLCMYLAYDMCVRVVRVLCMCAVCDACVRVAAKQVHDFLIEYSKGLLPLEWGPGF